MTKSNSEADNRGGAQPLDYYLFAPPNGKVTDPAELVFYKVEGHRLAQGLCKLCVREFGKGNGGTSFDAVLATTVPREEQVILDEVLDDLEVYDELHPGVYDPERSKSMMKRAQYAVRARRWEELLRKKLATAEPNRESNVGGSSENPMAGLPSGLTREESQNARLGLLMLLAQAYYRMLESVVGNACLTLDLELNASYLWTTKNLRNLLRNDERCRDFPMKFEPVFPDLYPMTVRDVDWEDIAPSVERFLSAVQEYVMDKGIYEPEEDSPAWIFIEMFRPGVKKAIDRGIAYRKRMTELWQEQLARTARPPKMVAKSRVGTDGRRSAGSDETSTGVRVEEPAAGKRNVSAAEADRERFGLLEHLPDFRCVWMGGVRYDLSKRLQARHCIEFMVNKRARDEGSAVHEDEIHAYVKQKCGSKNASPKIHHYFNGRLKRLQKQLIRAEGRTCKYYLGVG